MTEHNASKGGLELDAEDVMREIERLQAEGRPRLLGTLFYLMQTQEVRFDFSQVSAPTEEELAAVYDASPGIGSRLVTAYSDALTELRRTERNKHQAT